ncbi:MAG: radical SAM family heme chaperone HemW [Chloroflexi bacterium]|nr:radical SAM family heme chaperone HemW [Chloroflexota bacterium]
MIPHSIYIHIPFCRQRCNYCDFNTYAGLHELIPAYSDALIQEIQILASGLDQPLPVHTIYFGGGTPSLLPAESLEKLLEALNSAFRFDPPIEITLEANPGALSLSYLRDLRGMGFNRISLGMQSAHPGELVFLGRSHDYGDVVNGVEWARLAGFDNLSLDLIFGLPEQRIAVWRDSLDLALRLSPEHFSLYALSIEHGTPLGRWADRGLIPLPDPDEAADMYELAKEKLDSAGYIQYEISNWAKSPIADFQYQTSSSRFACKHNLQYWRNLPYLGVGAGAHGYANNVRTANVLSPREYIHRLLPSPLHPPTPFPQTPATLETNPIDRDTEMRETMLMGLRLTREGVSDERFQARFGVDLSRIFAEEISELVNLGLLEWVDDRLRLTARGCLLGNQVFVRFV